MTSSISEMNKLSNELSITVAKGKFGKELLSISYRVYEFIYFSPKGFFTNDEDPHHKLMLIEKMRGHIKKIYNPMTHKLYRFIHPRRYKFKRAFEDLSQSLRKASGQLQSKCNTQERRLHYNIPSDLFDVTLAAYLSPKEIANLRGAGAITENNKKKAYNKREKINGSILCDLEYQTKSELLAYIQSSGVLIKTIYLGTRLNFFDDEDLKKIAHSCPKLNEIELRNSPLITREGLKPIKEMNSMHILRIRKCYQICTGTRTTRY